MGFGIATIPGDLFLAFFSARFGALADRYGPRIFMTVGPAVMGLGLLWFARLPPTSAPWRLELTDPSSLAPPAAFATDVLPGFVIFGIGLMIMVAPLTTALMRSVPERNSGVASAFNNAVSRVGPQLAGALLFIVISSTFYASLAARLPGSDPDALRARVSPLNAVARADSDLAAAARAASTDAFHVAMLAAAVMCWAGAAINAAGIRNPTARPEPVHRPVAPCRQAPPVET
jgi:MFS family permease